jgi:omega-6 fatty acid desaturase (delta-12 desaturase)
MLSGKDLIVATKEFAKEDKLKSWFLSLSTVFILIALFAGTYWNFNIYGRIICSILAGLVIVRLFVIYHDHQHGAILQKSKIADIIFICFGVFILAPPSIWKRSHDFHHKHNSKMPVSEVGAFPTITKEEFLSLSKVERFGYLASRHPITILFGYLSIFFYSLTFYSFWNSPKKHIDCGIAILIHFTLAICILWFLGIVTFILSFFIPFFIACGMGSYLFYIQHNFPGVTFSERKNWSYEYAALESSSYLVLNPVMSWFTANIGYHHIHHINARIPFYRLPEAMRSIPELQKVKTTSFKIKDVVNCLSLKFWDSKTRQMVGLKELKKSVA